MRKRVSNMLRNISDGSVRYAIKKGMLKKILRNKYHLRITRYSTNKLSNRANNTLF